MFPIELAVYQTKPRRTEISAHPITIENREQFWQCSHLQQPLLHLDVIAALCSTKHGLVEAQYGDYIVFGDGEAYPIKPDELLARYDRAID